MENTTAVPTKKCSSCQVVRATSEFSRCSASLDGLNSQCKGCVAAYYDSNREHWRKYGRDRLAKIRKARELGIDVKLWKTVQLEEKQDEA